MDVFFFWLFSIGMIVCGLSVILNRNPVASALCFAFTIVFMSALFVMLNAFFLAAVQILVTAGAVMVLFLFIIMLLDITAAEHIPRQKFWMACTLLLALGFILLVARTLHGIHMGERTADSLTAVPAQTKMWERLPEVPTQPTPGVEVRHGQAYTLVEVSNDDTHQIGRLLFGRYVAPFEVTSLLILVATIGVVVICKQVDNPRPSPTEEITREAPPRVEPDPALTR